MSVVKFSFAWIKHSFNETNFFLLAKRPNLSEDVNFLPSQHNFSDKILNVVFCKLLFWFFGLYI